MKNFDRRDFLKASLLTGLGFSRLPTLSVASQAKSPTTYIAAYDTEADFGINSIGAIADMHKKHNLPATFFVVAGKINEQTKPILTRELNHPLFEIASHTYTHKLVMDSPHGKAVPPEQVRREIVDSKKMIEDTFGKELIGFRPAVGFATAFKGAKGVLDLVQEAGYRYTSSMLWGEDYTLPAELVDPFSYVQDGYPYIWEIPGHGWHENLLKNNNKTGPRKLTLWPPKWPEVVPNGYIKTPQEEFAINKLFIDRAQADQKKHITFIWHPWSILTFDPKLEMLDLTFSYVKKIGLETGTFGSLYKQLV